MCAVVPVYIIPFWFRQLLKSLVEHRSVWAIAKQGGIHIFLFLLFFLNDSNRRRNWKQIYSYLIILPASAHFSLTPTHCSARVCVSRLGDSEVRVEGSGSIAPSPNAQSAWGFGGWTSRGLGINPSVWNGLCSLEAPETMHLWSTWMTVQTVTLFSHLCTTVPSRTRRPEG